jgi:hypothetical protein
MSELLTNSFLFFFSLLATTAVGFPVLKEVKISRTSSKIFLSFSLGFGLISLTGIVANLSNIHVFNSQLIAFALFASLSVFRISKIGSDFKVDAIQGLKQNSIFILYVLTSSIALLVFFSKIVMWTAGDGIFHASMIRNIVEGISLPLNLDYLDHFAFYPKLFHFYSAFFVKFLGFETIQVMKIIPLLIVIIASIGIYALSKELGFDEPVPLLSFLVSLAIWEHIFPLIWMGYPQLTSEMFIIASVLLLFIETRDGGMPRFSFIPILFLFLSHQRHFLFIIPMFIWIFTRYSLNLSSRKSALFVIYTFVGMVVFFTYIDLSGRFIFPAYLGWFFRNPKFKWDILFIWNVSIFAYYSVLTSAFKKKERGLELLWVILISWFILAILVDSRVIGIESVGDSRIYAKIFIPISIFAGLSFSRLIESVKRKKVITYLLYFNIFLVFGLLLNNAFVNTSTRIDWALSSADYDALIFLNEKNGIVVNVDNTGAWAYPISGLNVTNPRVGLQLIERSELIQNPNSEVSLEMIDELKKKNQEVFIFVSSVSVNRPGYWIFMERYPVVDVKNFEYPNYELVYEKENAFVFRFRG